MERGLDSFKVVLGNGFEAVDDVVQIDSHRRNLFISHSDARICRDIAHILFSYMFCHSNPHTRFSKPAPKGKTCP